MTTRSDGKFLFFTASVIILELLLLPPWTWRMSGEGGSGGLTRIAFSFWGYKPFKYAELDLPLLGWEIGIVVVAAVFSHAVCKEREKTERWKTYWIKASDPTGALLRPSSECALEVEELLRPVREGPIDYVQLLRVCTAMDEGHEIATEGNKSMCKTGSGIMTVVSHRRTEN
jgi:hypothetical protein